MRVPRHTAFAVAMVVLLVAAASGNGSLGRTRGGLGGPLQAAGAPGANGKVELLWDRYGVAHIFAADRESMFYANGWAQMHAQANLLLRLYGESRGRAAEYWGPSYAALDRWVQLNDVPETAKRWYDAQDPTFRRYWDEFARGINDYAKAHPDAGGEFRAGGVSSVGVVIPSHFVDAFFDSRRR